MPKFAQKTLWLLPLNITTTTNVPDECVFSQKILNYNVQTVHYIPLEKQSAAVLLDAPRVHVEFNPPHLEGCYFWLGKTWKRDFPLFLAEEDIRVPEHCLPHGEEDFLDQDDGCWHWIVEWPALKVQATVSRG